MILHNYRLSELVLYIGYIHSVDWGKEGGSMGVFRGFLYILFKVFAELFVFILREEYFVTCSTGQRVIQCKHR